MGGTLIIYPSDGSVSTPNPALSSEVPLDASGRRLPPPPAPPPYCSFIKNDLSLELPMGPANAGPRIGGR